MRIPILSGRDFRLGEARPGPAIVNQAFAREFFSGEDPLGKSFDVLDSRGGAVRMHVIGVAADARYRDALRVPIRPTFYLPFRALASNGDQLPVGRGTFVVRTASSADPVSLSALLRKEVSRARPEFRVSNIRTQNEIVKSKTVRERVLAILALFFAGVAILLAAVGLYGVLDYSVLKQRREIGIRIAIGARSFDVIKEVTAGAVAMIVLGAIAGLGGGLGCVRYIESILFQASATDLVSLLRPPPLIVGACAVAAGPAILRALRIDPVEMLRSE